MSFVEKKDLIESIVTTESEVAKRAPYDSEWFTRMADFQHEIINKIETFPDANVQPVPPTGIGDMSDGYHTFNQLYYQRMMLFAALVRAYKGLAWKSLRHEDGELCFGGGWFIVGLDTPEGSYTYHYEEKYFALFDCSELPVAKHWDGHTEDDVTRLLSLPEVRPVVRGFWWTYPDEEPDANGNIEVWCSECDSEDTHRPGALVPFCWHCGASMEDDLKRLYEPPSMRREYNGDTGPRAPGALRQHRDSERGLPHGQRGAADAGHGPGGRPRQPGGGV